MRAQRTDTRRGMTSVQAVGLLGAAFLFAWGLLEAWDAGVKPAKGNTELTMRGEFLKPVPSNTGKPLPGTEIRRRPLTTTTIPGVTIQPDGRVVSTPITANADGTGNGVTNAEQERNLNAIEVAVARSPLGIAVVAGDHAGGGPSAIDLGSYFSGEQAFDHVAIAVRVGDRVEILEMIPDELRNSILRNIGGASPGPRTPETFARGYDTVHALPIAGLTPEQAKRFIEELRKITAAGNSFGFVVGQVCSTAIAVALERAGVPTDLDPSTLGLNDLLPRSVIEEFERLRRTQLGRDQIALYRP